MGENATIMGEQIHLSALVGKQLGINRSIQGLSMTTEFMMMCRCSVVGQASLSKVHLAESMGLTEAGQRLLGEGQLIVEDVSTDMLRYFGDEERRQLG